MTTIISRLYADTQTAQGVAAHLDDKGFPASTYDIIPAGEGASQAMTAAKVHADDAAAYAAAMAPGSALCVVRAPFTPFGAALEAEETLDSAPSVPVEGARGNRYIPEQPKREYNLSVLTSHPKFLTSDIGPYAANSVGLFSQAMSWPLLTKHRTKRSASSGWHASRAFWPMPLLSKHREKRSAISGGKRYLYNPDRLS